MKKLALGLVGIIIVLVGLLLVMSQDSSKTLYKDAPTVLYADIEDDLAGTNYYYIYKEDCSWCVKIKPDIAKYYYNKPEDVDFYLIDAANLQNINDGFELQPSEGFVTPSGTVESYKDIQATGTPTLVEITDGEITNFVVGGKSIPEFLTTLETA
ncbi:hypothetical protein RZE82_00165 [Mollicutes bacterium LVI A0039]|nr:hypothetical protein RZE82_00165 [Mollicutes bacterium LVI A0039]